MYKISKRFSFDAAHRIWKHFGKCANIHGHTYEIIVHLNGEELNEFHVLKDYYHFKEFKEYVDNVFDHALVIQKDDIEMVEVAQSLKTKHVILEATTAEYLAKHFYYKARELYENLVFMVEVKETPNTGAIYHE